MTAFWRAYERDAAAVSVARQVYDLEHRIARRYQLWTRSEDDPAIRALAQRIAARRRNAIEVAARAQDKLEELWDRMSRAMPAGSGIAHGQASLHEMDLDEFRQLVAEARP